MFFQFIFKAKTKKETSIGKKGPVKKVFFIIIGSKTLRVQKPCLFSFLLKKIEILICKFERAQNGAQAKKLSALTLNAHF